MKRYSPVTHVIFDLDGTILDTDYIYAEIYRIVLEKYGKEFTDEDRLAVSGVPKSVGCTTVVEKYQLPITAQEFCNQMGEEGITHLKKTVLKPGAERLIRHLSSKKVPIAIASSSSQESFVIKTEKYKELFALFNHMVIGSPNPEVPNGKPAPDIFLVCASKFPKKPQPNEVRTSMMTFEPYHGDTDSRALLSLVVSALASIHKARRKGKYTSEFLHWPRIRNSLIIKWQEFTYDSFLMQMYVFEDSANGVLAAKAAGMQVVMVPEDYCPLEMTGEATLVLHSIEQFLPEQFGLPPYS